MPATCPRLLLAAALAAIVAMPLDADAVTAVRNARTQRAEASTPAADAVSAASEESDAQVSGDPGAAAPPVEPAEPSGEWLPPLQGHRGPEIYTLDGTSNPAVIAFTDELRAAGNMDWVRGALDRGSLYRSHIVSLLELYGLPYELLFLPVIESEYRPWAVSRSGAVGLWQFMSNSIDGRVMRIDDMVDERRDFWKASDAALRKLKANYQFFGDWLLAIAAYNCGAGALDRIIKATGIRDYWQLRDGGFLPPETARFIPKFLGTARVCCYPGRYGLPTSWEGTVLWERLPMDKSVNIELLAAVTGAPIALLERGNAELHYPVTPPTDGGLGYSLKVPRPDREKIVAALADPSIALMRYHIYTIRTGDTLYGLGERYGVSVELIQRHNVGVDARALRIGSKLFIPLLGDPKQDELIAADQPTPPPPLTATYTVQKGDTLWSVSRRHLISVEGLAAGNGIPVDAVIHPGDVLKVPDVSGIMAEP